MYFLNGMSIFSSVPAICFEKAYITDKEWKSYDMLTPGGTSYNGVREKKDLIRYKKKTTTLGIA